jgi:hypothetical protein
LGGCSKEDQEFEANLHHQSETLSQKAKRNIGYNTYFFGGILKKIILKKINV